LAPFLVFFFHPNILQLSNLNLTFSKKQKRLPFYFFFKLCFLVYLFHPQTKGALFIYNSFIRQFLSKHERIIDEKTRQYTDQATKKVQETLDSNPTAKLAANMGTAMANDALKNMTEHSE